VIVSSLVGVIDGLNDQIADLQEELEACFEQRPSAEVLRSLPGLGIVLGARVLGEFGDDPTRYADARASRNYAGTAPITRTSGTGRVVLARVARNKPDPRAPWHRWDRTWRRRWRGDHDTNPPTSG